MKYHLAKILGHDVLICTKSTLKIMQMAHDAIYEKDKKEVQAANRAEVDSDGVARSSRSTHRYGTRTHGSERDSTRTDSPSTRASPFFVPRTRDRARPSIQPMVKKNKKQTGLRGG